MRISDFALLADENINPFLVTFLQESGFDIVHVNDVKLGNTADHVILNHAYIQGWVVLTLDEDFGTLVFKNRQPFIGIIRLHPGHLVGNFHLPTIKAILSAELDFTVPFLLVAEKHTDHVHIRYRDYTL